jgi:hypothetical protein
MRAPPVKSDSQLRAAIGVVAPKAWSRSMAEEKPAKPQRKDAAKNDVEEQLHPGLRKDAPKGALRSPVKQRKS